MTKFSQMQYSRPELEETNAKYEALLNNFKAAKTADECFAVYKEINSLNEVVDSMMTLAEIRNSLDTNDEFYSDETDYLDEIEPELEEVLQEISKAMLESPFRKDMEAAWGKLMFTNKEMELKTFSPEIIEDLQEENELCSEYSDLMASAAIEFDGKTLNLSELAAYYQNPDRKLREAALRANSDWYIKNSGEFDKLFDSIVKVRTRMATKLGYKSFTELGYYRMQRTSYNQEMVAKFREGIVKYIVPLVAQLKAEQAKRICMPNISIIDNEYAYPDGNPMPKGTPEEIFAHGKKMYAELSDETKEFFDFMLENELIDVLTRPGKEVGGYMTTIPIHKASFIFANFNGTSADIDVLTHEAGHSYAGYVARDLYPLELQDGSQDIAEIHSMSMEFLTYPWMEGFFGEDTKKYYHYHLSNAITFLPYGCMVDEFQHLIYEKPEMTPGERNKVWLTLEKKYRPWLDDANIPRWAEGRVWQAQMHIYEDPFYYIDYCLAQVVALNFLELSQKDHKNAWAKYKKLLDAGYSKTFVELVADSELVNPFESDNLKQIATTVVARLEVSNI